MTMFWKNCPKNLNLVVVYPGVKACKNPAKRHNGTPRMKGQRFQNIWSLARIRTGMSKKKTVPDRAFFGPKAPIVSGPAHHQWYLCLCRALVYGSSQRTEANKSTTDSFPTFKHKQWLHHWETIFWRSVTCIVLPRKNAKCNFHIFDLGKGNNKLSVTFSDTLPNFRWDFRWGCEGRRRGATKSHLFAQNDHPFSETGAKFFAATFFNKMKLDLVIFKSNAMEATQNEVRTGYASKMVRWYGGVVQRLCHGGTGVQFEGYGGTCSFLTSTEVPRDSCRIQNDANIKGLVVKLNPIFGASVTAPGFWRGWRYFSLCNS